LQGFFIGYASGTVFSICRFYSQILQGIFIAASHKVIIICIEEEKEAIK